MVSLCLILRCVLCQHRFSVSFLAPYSVISSPNISNLSLLHLAGYSRKCSVRILLQADKASESYAGCFRELESYASQAVLKIVNLNYSSLCISYSSQTNKPESGKLWGIVSCKASPAPCHFQMSPAN